MSQSRLFVGIGSPHGDDRAGWVIARRLSAQWGGFLQARCARTPAELLDWLEGIDTLDICDAVVAKPGSVHCWEWPTQEIERLSFRGTHDLALPAALMLADQLGRLPRNTRIWGIGIKPPRPADRWSTSTWAAGPLSFEVAAAVSTVFEQFCEAFTHA